MKIVKVALDTAVIAEVGYSNMEKITLVYVNMKFVQGTKNDHVQNVLIEVYNFFKY